MPCLLYCFVRNIHKWLQTLFCLQLTQFILFDFVCRFPVFYTIVRVDQIGFLLYLDNKSSPELTPRLSSGLPFYHGSLLPLSLVFRAVVGWIVGVQEAYFDSQDSCATKLDQHFIELIVIKAWCGQCLNSSFCSPSNPCLALKERVDGLYRPLKYQFMLLLISSLHTVVATIRLFLSVFEQPSETLIFARLPCRGCRIIDRFQALLVTLTLYHFIFNIGLKLKYYCNSSHYLGCVGMYK